MPFDSFLLKKHYNWYDKIAIFVFLFIYNLSCPLCKLLFKYSFKYLTKISLFT